MKIIYVTFLILILCLGCSEDEKSSPATSPTVPVNTPAGGVIGQWIYEYESGISVLTIYGNSNNTVFQEEHPDGTVYFARVEEVDTEDNTTRRFNEINSFEGKYYIINDKNDLTLFDSVGKIRTASPK